MNKGCQTWQLNNTASKVSFSTILSHIQNHFIDFKSHHPQVSICMRLSDPHVLWLEYMYII